MVTIKEKDEVKNSNVPLVSNIIHQQEKGMNELKDYLTESPLCEMSLRGVSENCLLVSTWPGDRQFELEQEEFRPDFWEKSSNSRKVHKASYQKGLGPLFQCLKDKE